MRGAGTASPCWVRPGETRIKFQGLDPKFTGVFPAKIIHDLLS
jgi:hypothetical protein